jgi:hypothetical protein
MHSRIIATLGLCALGLGAEARADGLRYDWRLEDGAEYDSNPARAEHIAGTLNPPAAGASPLARVVASGNLATAIGERQALALSGAFGGKWFTASDARAENVLVWQGAVNDDVRLWARTRLIGAASYYDVFQRRSTDLPDFRSFAPSLRLDQEIARSIVASLGGGYRWFTFKPDDAYSFAAPTAFVALKYSLPGNLVEGGADWEWTAGGSIEDRGFHGPACRSTGCGDGTDVSRHRDRFWIGHAEVTRTGNWLLGVGAAGHVNQSNSYGESLTRGLFHLRTVVLLPWDLSLSARGELVVTHYADALTFQQPIAGLPSASIEDESRSTLRVEVVRLFESRFEVGARYVYYTSWPASGPVDFRRQTLLFYFAFIDEP